MKTLGMQKAEARCERQRALRLPHLSGIRSLRRSELQASKSTARTVAVKTHQFCRLRVPHVQIRFICRRGHRLPNFASCPAQSGTNVDLGIRQFIERDLQSRTAFQALKVTQYPSHDISVFSVPSRGHVGLWGRLEGAHLAVQQSFRQFVLLTKR
jgi:hypothetical protein